MFAALSALVLSATFVAAQTGCSRTYTVKDGDYCDAISAANNASTYQLAVSNYQTINDGCSNLEVGQTLCLGTPSADCTTTYIIQPGDYCDLIASNFRINSTLLHNNNPQVDELCSNIYVGEVLCVASTVQVTPPPPGWTLPGASLDDGSYSSVSSDSPATIPTTTPAAIVVTSTSAATTTLVLPDNAATGGSPSTDGTTSNNSTDDSSSDNNSDDGDCDDDNDSEDADDENDAEDDDGSDCDDDSDN